MGTVALVGASQSIGSASNGLAPAERGAANETAEESSREAVAFLVIAAAAVIGRCAEEPTDAPEATLSDAVADRFAGERARSRSRVAWWLLSSSVA